MFSKLIWFVLKVNFYAVGNVINAFFRNTYILEIGWLVVRNFKKKCIFKIFHPEHGKNSLMRYYRCASPPCLPCRSLSCRRQERERKGRHGGRAKNNLTIYYRHASPLCLLCPFLSCLRQDMEGVMAGELWYIISPAFNRKGNLNSNLNPNSNLN